MFKKADVKLTKKGYVFKHIPPVFYPKK